MCFAQKITEPPICRVGTAHHDHMLDGGPCLPYFLCKTGCGWGQASSHLSRPPASENLQRGANFIPTHTRFFAVRKKSFPCEIAGDA